MSPSRMHITLGEGCSSQHLASLGNTESHVGGIAAVRGPTHLACRVFVISHSQHFALVSKMLSDGDDTQADFWFLSTLNLLTGTSYS